MIRRNGTRSYEILSTYVVVLKIFSSLRTQRTRIQRVVTATKMRIIKVSTRRRRRALSKRNQGSRLQCIRYYETKTSGKSSCASAFRKKPTHRGGVTYIRPFISQSPKVVVIELQSRLLWKKFVWTSSLSWMLWDTPNIIVKRTLRLQRHWLRPESVSLFGGNKFLFEVYTRDNKLSIS